jgi:hypothetical protein
MLTGQVAPPAQPYSLRADLQAWQAAIRGLRDNPLLTHLRLAEQRRMARLPRWRRNLPLICTGAGLSLMFVYLLHVSPLGIWAGRANIAIYATIIIAILWYALWFIQGIFEAVLGALGVLGRWRKRPNHLVLDDFASLTNLGDHEIAAGAAASLLPPLAWRIIVGSMLLVVLLAVNLSTLALHGRADNATNYPPLVIDYGGYDSSGTLVGSIGASASLIAPFGLMSLLLGFAAALGLVLWFITLGRSLNVEKIGIIVAATAAISQTAYPLLLAYLQSSDFSDGVLPGVSSGGAGMAGLTLILLVLAPAVLTLLLALARRLPWFRAVLTLASPVLYGVLLLCLPFLLYSIADAVAGDTGTSVLFDSLPSNVALATGGLSILAPQAIISLGWAENNTDILYIVNVAMTLLFISQLIILLIISRFAIEAVGARRRRGE